MASLGETCEHGVADTEHERQQVVIAFGSAVLPDDLAVPGVARNKSRPAVRSRSSSADSPRSPARTSARRVADRGAGRAVRPRRRSPPRRPRRRRGSACTRRPGNHLVRPDGHLKHAHPPSLSWRNRVYPSQDFIVPSVLAEVSPQILLRASAVCHHRRGGPERRHDCFGFTPIVTAGLCPPSGISELPRNGL